MRPASIIWFERLFLLGLALGLVNGMIQFDTALAQIESDPKLAQLGWGTGFVVTVMAISLLIPLLLWFLIARRASNIAKWVLVIFTVPGLFFLPSSAEQMSTSAFVLTWVLTAIQLAAISFLFKRDAREWLSPTAEEEDDGFKRGVNLK